jgi:hypothetical protein
MVAAAAMASIAWRIAGREAATVALLAVSAYQQFTPGVRTSSWCTRRCRDGLRPAAAGRLA